MIPKVKKDTKQTPNKSGAEKPVSLWGAKFQDVLKALLKTKPIDKQNEKKSKTTSRRNK